MTTAHDDPRFLVPFVSSAWKQLVDLVGKRPELVRCRETQLHFEFARLLADCLQKEGLRHWQDYELFVDTPEATVRLGFGWSSIGARPDIALVLMDRTAGALPIVIEVKLLETSKAAGDDEFGAATPCYSNVTTQSHAWTWDRTRLLDFVGNTDKVKAIGYMCTFHWMARGTSNRTRTQFGRLQIPWQPGAIQSAIGEIRFALQEIQPKPPFSLDVVDDSLTN